MSEPIPGIDDPYVHRCMRCGKESATWTAIDLPRGWVRVDALHALCKRCRNRVAEEE